MASPLVTQKLHTTISVIAAASKKSQAALIQASTLTQKLSMQKLLLVKKTVIQVISSVTTVRRPLNTVKLILNSVINIQNMFTTKAQLLASLTVQKLQLVTTIVAQNIHVQLQVHSSHTNIQSIPTTTMLSARKTAQKQHIVITVVAKRIHAQLLVQLVSIFSKAQSKITATALTHTNVLMTIAKFTAVPLSAQIGQKMATTVSVKIVVTPRITLGVLGLLQQATQATLKAI